MALTLCLASDLVSISRKVGVSYRQLYKSQPVLNGFNATTMLKKQDFRANTSHRLRTAIKNRLRAAYKPSKNRQYIRVNHNKQIS